MKGILANWWLILAVAGFLGYVGPFPSWLRLLNFFFLWPVVWPLVRSLLRRGEMAGTPPAPEPPLAPVAGGKVAMYARLGFSMVGLFLWPPALVAQLRQYIGDRSAAARAVPSVDAYKQKVRYSLPFSGEWYIFNGGPDRANSHSWDIVAQRYAYDFVIVDSDLRRWCEGADGATLTDYLCYDQPIRAPADGVVVAVEEGIRDAPRPGTGWLDPAARDIRGNCVVIEHSESEYSCLAHLAPGSVGVRVGERVARGQEVGRCGNSGNSSEPHLHFHIQDRADFYTSAGLPVAFDGVSVDGDTPEPRRYVRRGTRVRAA